MKVTGNRSGQGFGRAEHKLLFMAGVEVDLAPWEHMDLPRPIAQELFARSKGGLEPYTPRPWWHVYPWQIKVRATCP